MSVDLQPINHSIWKTLPLDNRDGFQEVWYLKLNDPKEQKALWLRFLVLVSRNGFRRSAETWALHFQRNDKGEVAKTALRQVHDLGTFNVGKSLKIAGCELSGDRTFGEVSSKGSKIRWDFTFKSDQPASFDLIPRGLASSGLVKNRVVTVSEDLQFSGTTEVNGLKQNWTNAPGMQGHLSGPRSGHSWVWGHCNSFTDTAGAPVPFVFEGLSARARILGSLRMPRMSTFYFRYRGEEHRFNSLWDVIHSRSQTQLNQWTFRVERGDLVFHGEARADFRDFAGLTFEDTDGSLLYCANSKLSDLKILVYRRGKLESTLIAKGTAAFEIVDRHQNPYVPLMM